MPIPVADLESAFPPVNPGEWPVGPRILVQLQTIREKTQGGIVLVEETREVNKSLTQIGKIIAVGHIAYRNRDSGQLWPEGVWAKPGDIVRIPKYVGQRFEREIPGTKDRAAFIILEDHQVTSVVDPSQFEKVSEVL